MFLGGNKSYITSFEIVKNNTSKIILLESYPCKNRDELQQREQYKNKAFLSFENKKLTLNNMIEFPKNQLIRKIGK